MSARILCIGEPATFAHQSRAAQCAEWFHKAGYETYFASGTDTPDWLVPEGVQFIPLFAITSSEFLSHLHKGTWPYNKKLLAKYVKNDLALLRELQPELVVGDFRLSLCVSARTAAVPFFHLTNAYWSPLIKSFSWPVPVYGPLRRLPVFLAQQIFQLTIPLVMRGHLSAINHLRKLYDLTPYKSFLDAFTDGDRTLYVDAAEHFPFTNDDDTHRCIGPVVWSPKGALPEELTLPGDKPLVYVSLGSSAPSKLYQTIFQALKSLDITLVVTTGENDEAGFQAPSVKQYPYLPGDKICARANLVICNGGSPTAYQALLQGTPVLGIASNLDQFLCMHFLTKTGAAISLRGEPLDIATLRATTVTMLNEGSFTFRAREVQQTLLSYSPQTSLLDLAEIFIKSKRRTKGDLNFDFLQNVEET